MRSEWIRSLIVDSMPLTVAGLAANAIGCASIPRGASAVDSVSIQEDSKIAERDIEERLATKESRKFLGLFRGVVYDYEIFNIHVLRRDLARIERYFQARGYYQAKARTARVRSDDNHVRVTIRVDAGPRTQVEHVEITGLDGLSSKVQRAVRHKVKRSIDIGDPFEEKQFERAEAALEETLANRGYAFVETDRQAEVDLPNSSARLRFVVRPGEMAHFSTVHIEGLEQIPEGPVRRAVSIDRGDVFSRKKLRAARQSVLDLGVFADVDVQPRLDGAARRSKSVPVDIRVEVAKHRSVRLGIGAQADVIRTDVHLIAGWEHRNFLGGLRDFSLEHRPGVVLFPTRIPSFQRPSRFLPEQQTRASLTQPGLFDSRTSGLLQLEYSTFPLLLSPEVDPDAPVIGYQEGRVSAGASRHFGALLARPTHNVQVNAPFAYKGTLDPALEPVVVSFLDLHFNIDLRDDRVHPTRGVYLGKTVQLAGLGGHARDVKVQPEVRGYVPLGSGVTIATRATLGLLFPFNYTTAAAGSQERPPGMTRAQWFEQAQISLLRAFFSGGPSSNRGYAPRGVGPHGVVPFFAPQSGALDCTQEQDSVSCRLPLGGPSLWEATLELRYPIVGNFTAATFCDASDVSSKQLDIRPQRPHLSCGEGLRYATPVGAIRLDVGYRVPKLQVLERHSSREEGRPGSILGLPLAVSFGVGEVF
jgi:outer membrane protein assembly factor BamA